MSYVVDACVVINWLFAPVDSGEYVAAEAFLDGHADLVAPPVLLPEVLGRIAGLSNASGPERISAETAAEAADLFVSLGIELQNHPFTYAAVPRLLALGANLGMADATYVLLGEALGVPVITQDDRMIRAATKVTRHEVRRP